MPPLANSLGKARTPAIQARTRQVRAGGPRLTKKLAKEIPLCAPISMFCGLPTMVAQEPIFAETATPMR